MKIKLSILVATIPNRINNYYLILMNNLIEQVKSYDDVELISFFDNKKRTIGRKRNEMVNVAQGEYIVFIDDDDRISPDYVKEIMTALYENPNTDCVVFDVLSSTNGGLPVLSKYGIEYNFGYVQIENRLEWRSLPTHIMVYKSEITKRYGFGDVPSVEDTDFIIRAFRDIKEQTRINKILYFYDANYLTTSECMGLSEEVVVENLKKRFNVDSLTQFTYTHP